MRDGAHVVMLCTAGRGGMRSVVEGLERDGLFARWRVLLIDTHVEGSLGSRLGVAARALLRFVRMIAQRRVALVHAHVAMRGSFWRKSVFMCLAKAAGIPVVLHLHGSEFADFYARQAGPAKRMTRTVFAVVDRVMVLSQPMADLVAKISPKARTLIVPNYVTLPGPTSRVGRSTVQFLFLGLIGQRKGVYDLLPAFREAATGEDGWHLIIGGNGAEEQARALASELGISDKVTFAGWIAGSAKEDQLAKADVFVLPSYNEGLPISILEAMAAGLPIISTPVGGIPQLVRTGTDGLIVEAGDIGGLAAALRKLGEDSEQRLSMGASAFHRVRADFSSEATLSKIERTYRELLGEAQADMPSKSDTHREPTRD